MAPFTLPFASPEVTLESVGGKGQSLAKMAAAGLPVPGGFHVTTAAYHCFITANALQPRILAPCAGVDPTDPNALETASQAIQTLFTAGVIPQEVVESVSQSLAAVPNSPLAVRSSATAEDLPEASFAGQQETYLNVRGETAVLDAIRRCWASLWTARAIAYRLKNGIDQAAVMLAVVVQELVPAEAAGVLFTANPLNGRRNELVINAAWGLGEAIVSGMVTPDTLIFDKEKQRVIHQGIAQKQVQTVRTVNGVQEIPVPRAKQKKAVLRRVQATELAQLGMQIEQFYGAPVDVEWALAHNRLFILQARPITVLPVEWRTPNPQAIYTRASLAEQLPGPVTPLFATLGLDLANRATIALWDQVMGKDGRSLLVEGGYYQPLHGYVYGVMRLTGKDYLTVLKLTLRNLGALRGSLGRWQTAHRELAATVAEWEAKQPGLLSLGQLLDAVRLVFGAACRYFTQVQMVMPAALMSEMLFTRLYSGLVRRKQDLAAEVFLLGSETSALRAEKSLYDLSRWMIGNPALADFLLRTPTAELAVALVGEAAPADLPADLWREWRARFLHHLGEFGRTAYEFDFANPTPAETPGPPLDALKAYLLGQAQDPYRRQTDAIARREAATHEVLSRTGWPRKGWFEKLLRWAQATGPLREESIFDLGMGHPCIRRMLSELGHRFVEAGGIAAAEDIYWLEQAEVEDMAARLEGGEPLPDRSCLIPGRKEAWRAALKISAPVMLPEKTAFSGLMYGREVHRKAGKVVLHGVGTSAGQVTAPACVLFGPEDFTCMRPGDVLVAVTTTPAWTPLFALASAVVTDIGGPLSHSSIVAREYGIPAVMAARGATRTIQNGQRISVDGVKGIVTIEG